MFCVSLCAPTRIWLDRRAPPSSGNATGQNLVDAATVEIDHLETPTLAVKTFAYLRQIAELAEREPGSRMIAAVRRQGDGQTVGHLVGRHAARDQPRSIVEIGRASCRERESIVEGA